MAVYVYQGIDAPGSESLRPGARDRHLAHLSGLDAAGRIRFAGPLLDDQGKPRGSVIVFDADSFEAAREIAEGDPYIAAGVFERVEVFETKAVFPSR